MNFEFYCRDLTGGTDYCPIRQHREGGDKMASGRRKNICVTGRVQGVGFRFFCRRLAVEMDLTGWVRNRVDGSVEVEVQGPNDRIDLFTNRLKDGPILATIANITEIDIGTDPGEKSFEIRY